MFGRLGAEVDNGRDEESSSSARVQAGMPAAPATTMERLPIQIPASRFPDSIPAAVEVPKFLPRWK